MIESVRRKAAGARIEGVSIQRQASGLEVILGLACDPQFGPILMFGLGGVLVEVLEDVVFRVVPLSEQDAREMLAEIKGVAVLKGFRGAPPANEAALIDAILRLSGLAAAFHDTIREIDINPLVVTPTNAFAVDGVLTMH
jgi:acyl-CoA synthetase (NDP forming)